MCFLSGWYALTRLTGVIFICMTVDYRILYALDEQAVQDGTVFYSTFFRAPVAIRVRTTIYMLRAGTYLY
jgi:hypothetical protein